MGTAGPSTSKMPETMDSPKPYQTPRYQILVVNRQIGCQRVLSVGDRRNMNANMPEKHDQILSFQPLPIRLPHRILPSPQQKIFSTGSSSHLTVSSRSRRFRILTAEPSPMASKAKKEYGSTSTSIWEWE